MSDLTYPTDTVKWPSIGGTVLDWLQEYGRHGPGDVVGEELKLSVDQQRQVWRLYEVYPCGHDREGQRRFNAAGLMKPKGWSKTELLALIAFAELAGPCRFDGWDADGDPVARPVVSPAVFLFAWSGDQVAEQAFETLRVIAEESPLADALVITQQFIERADGRGIAKSLTRSPNRADGSRVTFQGIDEIWRWTSPQHKEIHSTVEANAVKRAASDAWTLGVSTAYIPGQLSVAETLHERAKLGTATNFYFSHSFAADSFTLSTPEDREAAIRDAGTADHMNIARIAELWENPDWQRSELEQLWLCRPVASESQVFAMDRVKEQARPEHKIVSRAGNRLDVWVGFDGSRTGDSTGFICTTETGYQWCPYLWTRPSNSPGWEVPEDEVEEAWSHLNREYRVRGALLDPRFWETEVARWIKTYRGKGEVAEFHTEVYSRMHVALRTYVEAWNTGKVTYSGQRPFTEHLANARKYFPGRNGPDGEPIWVATKDRKGSPRKMDLAVAGCLSWTAYLRAGAGGVKAKSSRQGSDWKMY